MQSHDIGMSSGRWSLADARCIVTGGSKGLGLACVKEFLDLGASVLLTARGEQELSAVAEDLSAKYGASRVHYVAADVSTSEGRERIVERASAIWDGTLDVLVNNAGMNTRKAAADFTVMEYEAMVATNQTSAFFLCTACLPLLRKSSRASVVNVSSLAGIRSSGTGVPYAMTKAAMVHMTEALACEWAGYKIRVNCVAPWMVRTPMLEAAVAKDPTALDAAMSATPYGCLGEPADTAGAVSFLCMPAAAYITGQVLAVDGGLAAQGFRGPCVVPHEPLAAAVDEAASPSSKRRRA